MCFCALEQCAPNAFSQGPTAFNASFDITKLGDGQILACGGLLNGQAAIVLHRAVNLDVFLHILGLNRARLLGLFLGDKDSLMSAKRDGATGCRNYTKDAGQRSKRGGGQTPESDWVFGEVHGMSSSHVLSR